MKNHAVIAVLALVAGGISAVFAGGPGGAAGAGGGRGGFGGGRGGAVLTLTTMPGSPVADGAQLVRLAAGLKFTEGCTSDKDGNVYFVDQDNNRIDKWTFGEGDNWAKGKLEVFMSPSHYANGQCFDPDWNLVTLPDESNELWVVHAPFPAIPKNAELDTTTGQPKNGALETLDSTKFKYDVLIKDYQGKQMNGINDVWVVPTGPQKGAMYLTDPFYQRRWWTTRPGGTGQQQPGKYVYYFSPDHKTLKPVITDFRTPNGIIGTADGKTLYVSDYDGNMTYSYTINDDGSLKDKKLFANVGSDGMTIDDAGNIYTTKGGQGLIVLNKDGQRVATVPRMQCANVCFGGKNMDILFICAQTEIYGLKMKTKGVGPQ